MQAHDAARHAHVPETKPGKRFYKLRNTEQAEDRRKAALAARLARPSRYEETTPVDDPGERKRLVYFIGRLFEPALIRHFSRNLDDTAAWEELPIPQLLALRDVLRNRLSKWLTKNKETHRFGFSTAATNPRSRTGIKTNDEIIGILLDRGQKIDMRAAAPVREETEPVCAGKEEEPF